MKENYIVTAVRATGLHVHIMEVPVQIIDGTIRLARQVRLNSTNELLEFLQSEEATDFAFLGVGSFKGLDGNTLEPVETKTLRFDWWPKSIAFQELKGA